MPDFWISCGHHLLDRAEGGGLVVTDAWLKAYLARPELVPPEDACAAECRLHAAVLADPRRAVTDRELAALPDADARENWEVMLAFRHHLLAHPTLEASYRALFDGNRLRTPKLFLDQLVHVILRNALDGTDDPIVLRAAELLYRPQRLSLHEGALLLADEEVVERSERDPQPTPLLRMFAGPQTQELDVLTPANAALYWARSDAFDTALPFALDSPGRAALGHVLERWIAHLLGVACNVTPIAELHDQPWAWFVGLDAEATAIGNDLWRGGAVAEADRARVVALYRLDLAEPVPVRAPVEGRPIWLLTACTEDRRIALKPQNLLAGLPLLGREAAA